MINLTASKNGFHLLNGAGEQLSPYAFLSSSVNASGRMHSEDGLSWQWELPYEGAPYAIRADAAGSGDLRTMSEIKFYRIEDNKEIEIGTMSIDPPLEINVTEPASDDEVWTTELALPFRLALQNQSYEVSGNSGDDFISFEDSSGAIRDPLIANGKAGDDRITGGPSNDTLKGGTGDDTLKDHHGDNTLVGGKGDDILEVSDPSGSSLLRGGAGNDFLMSGSGDDVLRGGTGNDMLMAGSGDDRLVGGQGDDYLIAGLGNDRMIGGEGSDTFEINTGLSGRNVIKDFKVDEDTLLLLNFSGENDDISLTQKGDNVIVSDQNDSFKLVLKDTDIDDLTTADIQIA
ncbi:MAG: calcium-binding protein [Pseudomonadota bacterium]